MLPAISEKKMADFRLYRDLTGQSLRDAVYNFDRNGQDLDAALTAWDKLEAHKKALAKLDPATCREVIK